MIATEIVDVAYKIHLELGAGLLESVYEKVMAYELGKRGMVFERQVLVPIKYDGLVFEEAFRADIIVEQKVVCELKSVETFAPVHFKQLLTYLKLLDLKLGLLINFGAPTIKQGIKRIINGYDSVQGKAKS
ncbi:MAG: GxxExxY protein [Verrucomicrobiae bacterium]|nr:GxxExxY protein [Verrucomicrobiae bacterium]